MDWRFNTIWTEQLSPGEYKFIDCDKREHLVAEPMEGSYVNLHRFKTKLNCFADLNSISSAIYVELHLSNIKSFRGIEKLGKIKRLEAHYCLKLESDNGLAGVKDHLEWLHINTSKKYVPSTELLALRNLKVLCLNSCGPLENLDFLKEFPELLDFRFVNTNVLSGDLSPILQHPTLVDAAFLNKRHYSHKDTEIAAMLKERDENAKMLAYKDEFMTYRYKALGDWPRA